MSALSLLLKAAAAGVSDACAGEAARGGGQWELASRVSLFCDTYLGTTFAMNSINISV
jgi:hypothetical protein